MKKISIIFLLTIIITFGLCIALENTAGGNFHIKNSQDNLLSISQGHSVVCDISAIIQKTFQTTASKSIFIIAGIIFLLIKLFKKSKDTLSRPLLISILINRREYYRKLSWSTPPLPKTFLRLNPKLYA